MNYLTFAMDFVMGTIMWFFGFAMIYHKIKKFEISKPKPNIKIKLQKLTTGILLSIIGFLYPIMRLIQSVNSFKLIMIAVFYLCWSFVVVSIYLIWLDDTQKR